MKKFNKSLVDSEYLTKGGRKKDSNYFRRKIAGNKISFISQLIKNTDQILIISSVVFPPCKTGLIDRLLVLANRENVKAILIFTKRDLINQYSIQIKKQNLIEKINFYQKNYDAYFISNQSEGKQTGKDKISPHFIQTIKNLLKDKITAIVGHSGVGKTTLLNHIEPNYKGKTNDVSFYTKRGKHTTTKINLCSFSFGGNFYDMPGLKEINFFSLTKEELSNYYPDFLKYKKNCKYYNCTHSHEKNCGVKDALEQNKIASFRYNNYLNLLDDISNI